MIALRSHLVLDSELDENNHKIIQKAFYRKMWFLRDNLSAKKKIKLRVLVSWTLNLIPHHTEPWNTSLYCTTYTLTFLVSLKTNKYFKNTRWTLKQLQAPYLNYERVQECFVYVLVNLCSLSMTKARWSSE